MADRQSSGKQQNFTPITSRSHSSATVREAAQGTLGCRKGASDWMFNTSFRKSRVALPCYWLGGYGVSF